MPEDPSLMQVYSLEAEAVATPSGWAVPSEDCNGFFIVSSTSSDLKWLFTQEARIVRAFHLTQVLVWMVYRRSLYRSTARHASTSTVGSAPHRTNHVEFTLAPAQHWQIPLHLNRADVLAFERDPSSWPVYADWLEDHDWPVRAAAARKDTLG